MKYLIQHRKEFAITVAAAIMAIINLIKAIRSGILSEDAIIAVIVTVLGVLAWYYNMPTSQENHEATEAMRQRKEEAKAGYVGERFFDDLDEEDVDE